MAEDISILDEFKSRTYDASLIATYNAFLPFYEDVVLRRLAAKGCLHNVVMMDAGQCGMALADAGTRPKRAGKDYSLLPVRISGAFHPKIILLVERSHGTLLVGSHNLTIAGYGLNHELTTRFEYKVVKDKPKDWAALATFQNAFRFLKDWAVTQPEELQEVLTAFERLAPWLREPLPAETEGYFIGAGRDGRPLWDAVRAKLPDKVQRITVVGPFFDSELAFLQQLDREYVPKTLVVAVDPRRSEISQRARQLLPRAEFVNASCLHGGQRYVHAKAVFFESAGGQEVLLTGSANPSQAAWRAHLSTRNAEAIVIQAGREGSSPATALGLTKLASQPQLSAAEWAQINEPARRPESKQSRTLPPVIALITDDGFEIAGPDLGKICVTEVKLLSGASLIIGT